MKFAGALRNDVPVLEDVLAGLAILVGPPGDGAPTIRLDAVGRHRVGSGSAQQAVLEDLVVEPLDRLGRRILDVDRYATELHDPEITEPAGAGNVPQRNYKLIGALAVKRGELGPRSSTLRARARPARLLADAGPRRLGGAVAPARARGVPLGRDRLDDARRQGLALPRPHDRAGRRHVSLTRTRKGVRMPVDATPETFKELTSEGSVFVDFWGPAASRASR